MTETVGGADPHGPPAGVGREEVVSALRAILLKQTGQDGEGWTEATPLKETGMTSFDQIECIFELEDRFKIDLDFNANDPKFKMETIGDLTRLVMDRLASQGPK